MKLKNWNVPPGTSLAKRDKPVHRLSGCCRPLCCRRCDAFLCLHHGTCKNVKIIVLRRLHGKCKNAKIIIQRKHHGTACFVKNVNIIIGRKHYGGNRGMKMNIWKTLLWAWLHEFYENNINTTQLCIWLNSTFFITISIWHYIG